MDRLRGCDPGGRYHRRRRHHRQPRRGDKGCAALLPAKPIRRRYDEETAARLEKLRWWDWPEAQVRRAIPLLQAGDLDALEKLV